MTQNGPQPLSGDQPTSADAQLHFDRSAQCRTDLRNIVLERQLAVAQAKVAELEKEKEPVEN